VVDTPIGGKIEDWIQEMKKRRTSRGAPTGHKLFNFTSFSFQSRRWAHIKRSTDKELIFDRVAFSIFRDCHDR
jgi:hypothetical protein